MCKFCKPMIGSPRPFNERLDEELVIIDNRLISNAAGFNIKINFCPICGRSLEQE